MKWGNGVRGSCCRHQRKQSSLEMLRSAHTRQRPQTVFPQVKNTKGHKRKGLNIVTEMLPLVASPTEQHGLPLCPTGFLGSRNPDTDVNPAVKPQDLSGSLSHHW